LVDGGSKLPIVQGGRPANHQFARQLAISGIFGVNLLHGSREWPVVVMAVTRFPANSRKKGPKKKNGTSN
jgi:hypothetical protein